jgi:Tfp pilus assembly protein PilF
MLKWVFIGVAVWLGVVADIAADQSTTVRFQAPCETWVGKIVSLQGEAFIMRRQETQWQPALMNDFFCGGDRLRVGANSRAAVMLRNDAVLRLDQNTTLAFNGIEAQRTFLIDLLRGTAYFFSREARSLKLTTPFVNGVVKGTEFLVRVDAASTLISLFEGSIQADNELGSLLLASGQSAVAAAGRPPLLQMVARPRDAVQWTLYYPPIVAFSPHEFESAPPDAWQTRVRRSIDDFRTGHLGQALARLEGVPAEVDDPRFFVYRAGLALAVGRAPEASKDIDRALALNANDSSALALRSIMAVVQNRKEDAFADAQRAVHLDPASPSARLALSYAYQARFDLEAALDQVRVATQQTPDNAMLWARLAELDLSFGDLDGALTAAQRAARLDSNIVRTHSVLGYAYLTQTKIELSKQAFARAIEIDSADPLSRLGLGLAQIREGDLTGGRANVEIAAALDPGNSLIRSYLGKAYYEEKRSPLDQHQFEIAKQLDPQDPTPHFYEAIRKQSRNQPIPALKDFETAIALNDNRAVYRSRFLLDQDLAARGASLSRIYRDLDFQELALREGFKSLHADPANYSAHRLLADTFTARPRHDIARASELLQAQLLQPINITPVQPQMAETGLFIFDGAGPAEPSFNEYNPLFLRNRVALQAGGVAGSKETLGDEVVVSAIHDNLSLSLGQFYYETDGFRENHQQKHEIYNAFVQVGLTHKTAVQAELRSRDTQRGDPYLRFDPDNYLSNVRRPLKLNSGRVGFHHGLAPSSDLLGSLIYTDAQYKFQFNEPFVLETEIQDKGYITEIEHLLRGNRFRLTSGLGYLNADREATFQVPDFFVDLQSKNTIEHLFGYLYAYIDFPTTMSWTLGLSAGRLRGFEDQEQLNPKFGVTWDIFEGTTLRAAAFRVLEDMYLAKQRLEPTHVAGFNQLYEEVLDGSEAVDVWNYGVGVDQKISSTLSAGVEFVRRELKVPYVDLFFSGAVEEVIWEEETTRLYLYATPLDWISLSFGYQLEKFQREAEFTSDEDFVDLDTHRASIGTRLFFPLGFFAGAKATYVDQEGAFGSGTNVVSGKDNFWVFDADMGYRFPKRFGTISLEGKNIFDESFRFQDTDPAKPSIYPDQYVLVKLTLSL